MSALAIVVIVFAGVFGYCGAAIYTYLRLVWYLRQDGVYDPEIPAFFWSLFLPVGVMYLVIRSASGADASGLAPRSVRREMRIKEQQAEIARLERELEIGR